VGQGGGYGGASRPRVGGAGTLHREQAQGGGMENAVTSRKKNSRRKLALVKDGRMWAKHSGARKDQNKTRILRMLELRVRRAGGLTGEGSCRGGRKKTLAYERPLSSSTINRERGVTRAAQGDYLEKREVTRRSPFRISARTASHQN